MTDSDHSDDTDQRFAELIKAEFGNSDGPELFGTRMTGLPRPPRSAPASRPVIDGYFDLQRAIEEVELNDDDVEHWTPPEPPAVGRPEYWHVLGTGLIVAALVVGIMVLAGWRPDLWVGVLTLVCAGAGLAVLLSSLPRQPEIGSDGAQL